MQYDRLLIDARPTISKGVTTCGVKTMSIFQRFREWREFRRVERQVAAELATYSPRELAELGIDSADVEEIARDAARLEAAQVPVREWHSSPLVSWRGAYA